MAILSRGCKPDNFEQRNSLKLSFTNIFIHSNFVECESFLKSNSPDILALCKTSLNNSIDGSVHDEKSSFKMLDYKNSIVSYTIIAVEEIVNLALHTAFPLSYLQLPLLRLK